MFVTVPSGTKYQLFIQHDHKPKNKRYSVVTKAEVKLEDGTILATGEAHCFAGKGKTPPDQFRRRKGVKLALKRAMEQVVGLDKADRDFIWKRVLNLVFKPKFHKGEAVCVRTKDSICHQWVNCIVERERPDGQVELRTDPGGVSLLLHRNELTKVKTVWMDSREPVKGEN